jgi:D-alanyl-D-alanine carboxypeptidase
MAVFRSRRAAVRRGLLILVTVTLTSVVSMTLGPVLSAQRLTGPIPAPLPSPSVGAGVFRDEPDTIHVPATQRPVPPVISSIAIRPREPDGPSATPVTRAALQDRLDQLRERYGIPGISVTILFPDGTTWVGVSGVADVATKTRVVPSTSFAIASVTKTFTAALIMALAEDGRLGLDDQVREYLPDLRISAKITVRQLLDHTSGLRDYFFHPAIDRVLLAHPERDWDAAESMKYVGKAYFKPGSGWHYSNTNYLVLGMLAEAVGGEPLADQIRARFIEPLGLGNTWYQPTETSLTHAARGYRFASGEKDAKPIDLSDGTPIVPFTSVVTAAAGAGGIASNSSDLARWARALYAGGVLEPESVQEMLDDIARTERYKPTVPYGLGVQLVDIDGERTLGHSGRLLGFRSAVRWLPDQDIAIAVLTNQSRTDPGIFVRALLKIARQVPVCRLCADQH